MRLARFRRPDGTSGFGTVEGDTVDETVVDLSARVPSFEDLVAAPVAPVAADPRLAVADVAWEPPIGTDAKVFCVGLNYSTHARETGRTMPERPILFVRFPDSLVGSGQQVVRPAESVELDWEGEVALVVGRTARRVPVADAPSYIAGWTIMAENSVRDWQAHSGQATAGKTWESSGACGPWLVTANEIGDPATDLLMLTTRLNGERVQHDHTGNLAFSPAELLAYISTFTTLRPGDVIATGTPAGVGARMEPPQFLRSGDALEVEVSRIGTLRHGVVDAPALVGATR